MSKLLSINIDSVEPIVAYLRNPNDVYLSEDLQIKLDQLDFCDNQIRNNRRRTEAAKYIQEKYKVSKPRAYQLILETEYVFGSINRFGKEYYRQFLIEKAMVELDKYSRNSNADGFNKTMKNLIILFGFDKNEETTINAELLQQHNYSFIVNFKNGIDSYELNLNNLSKMPNEEKYKLLKEVEAENIDFDMIDKLSSENK